MYFEEPILSNQQEESRKYYTRISFYKMCFYGFKLAQYHVKLLNDARFFGNTKDISKDTKILLDLLLSKKEVFHLKDYYKVPPEVDPSNLLTLDILCSFQRGHNGDGLILTNFMQLCNGIQHKKFQESLIPAPNRQGIFFFEPGYADFIIMTLVHSVENQTTPIPNSNDLKSLLIPKEVFARYNKIFLPVNIEQENILENPQADGHFISLIVDLLTSEIRVYDSNMTKQSLMVEQWNKIIKRYAHCFALWIAINQNWYALEHEEFDINNFVPTPEFQRFRFVYDSLDCPQQSEVGFDCAFVVAALGFHLAHDLPISYLRPQYFSDFRGFVAYLLLPFPNDSTDPFLNDLTDEEVEGDGEDSEDTTDHYEELY